jgi:hypothetical protein
MASLPYADQVQIDRRKLTDYLLSASHPAGRGKARFFSKLGFAPGALAILENALRGLAQNPERVESEDTGFGTKYIADGQLRGPKATASVRTVWIVDRGAEIPRLVTAYPRSG